MDLTYTPEEEAFRARVRAWIAEHAPKSAKPSPEDLRAWQRRLNDGGFLGSAWPSEYGGGRLSPMEQAIFSEELARADAPGPLGSMVGLSGACAHENASDDDVDVFLVARAGRAWCMYLGLVALSRALGVRRTLCVNYVVDEDELHLREHDVFTGAELVALRPLAGREAYCRLVRQNPWVAERFPNFAGRHAADRPRAGRDPTQQGEHPAEVNRRRRPGAYGNLSEAATGCDRQTARERDPDEEREGEIRRRDQRGNDRARQDECREPDRDLDGAADAHEPCGRAHPDPSERGGGVVGSQRLQGPGDREEAGGDRVWPERGVHRCEPMAAPAARRASSPWARAASWS